MLRDIDGSSRDVREWRVLMVLVFLALVGLSTRLLFVAYRARILTTIDSPLLYQAGTLGFNYVDFGFVRRGLAGSIVHLIGGDRLVATSAFHILSAVLVAGAACGLLARRPLRRSTAGVFILLFAALVGRWTEDAGRTDMLVATLLVLAVVMLTSARPVWACVAVGIGLFVHETALIFGIPLLVALSLNDARWRHFTTAQWIGVAAVLASALVLYAAFPVLPHADLATIVSTVQSRLPPKEHVDWAIYYAVSGWRGVNTSICQNAGDPTYVRHVLSGLLIIVLFVIILRQHRPPRRRLVLLASIPSYLFLCVIANDFSRWTVLAAFNVWLIAVSELRTDDAGRLRFTGLHVASAAAMIALLSPWTATVRYPIYVPSPAVDWSFLRFREPPTPPVSAALERCDPNWQEVLGDSVRSPGDRPRPLKP